MIRKAEDVIAQLRQGGCGRAAGQARADDDDVVLSLVGGIDQFQFEAVSVPLLMNHSVGDSGVEFQGDLPPGPPRCAGAFLLSLPE